MAKTQRHRDAWKSVEARRMAKARRHGERLAKLAQLSTAALEEKLATTSARFLRADIRFVIGMREEWRGPVVIARWSPSVEI